MSERMTTHECPICQDVHLPPGSGEATRSPEPGITYCRTCGKTRMVEWLHRDCPDDDTANA